MKNKKADQFLLTCLDTNLCRIFSREKLLDRVGIKNLFMKPDEFSIDLMKDDLEKLYTFYS